MPYLPNHADHGSGEHVVLELGKEWLLDKILVMLFQELRGGLFGLQRCQPVAFGLETRNNISNDTTLYNKREIVTID